MARLGRVLDASLGVLGGLGPSWASLGASWKHLGASWVFLGCLLGRLGRVLGRPALSEPARRGCDAGADGVQVPPGAATIKDYK